jgi:hypothetical protein
MAEAGKAAGEMMSWSSRSAAINCASLMAGGATSDGGTAGAGAGAALAEEEARDEGDDREAEVEAEGLGAVEVRGEAAAADGV